MTMKNLALLFTLLGSLSGICQQVNRDPSFLVTGSGFLNTRSMAPELEGKTVFFEEFKNGTVYIFSNGKTNQISTLLNYDIYLNRMVVNYSGQLFEIDAIKIDSVKFEIKKDSFLTATNVKYLAGLDKKGFGYHLFKGKNIELLKEVDIEVIKPTYNELMNVGSRNYLIKISDKYYIRNSGENAFKRFIPKKSSFLTLDASKKNTGLIKKSDLDKEQSIIQLFRVIDHSLLNK